MYQRLAIISAALLITIGLATGVTRAQIPAVIYSGTQSAPGTIDQVSGTTYGSTFVLSSTGEWDSRYLMISINHQNMFQGIGITGGAWSLSVFSDGLYLGTVYGDVISGVILYTGNRSESPVSKLTRMRLSATGGTGIFEAKHNEKINGSFDMTTDLRTLETKGTAFLNF